MSKGEGKGHTTVWESGAILQFLCDKFDTEGKFLPLPKDLEARYEVLTWLTFQVAGLGPNMGQVGHFFRYGEQQRGERSRKSASKGRG